MVIYIFTLFLVLFLWIVMNRSTFSVGGQVKFKDRNKSYAICMCIWLFLVAALRNYTVGTDTYTYLRRYTSFADSKWKNLFRLADRFMFEYGYVIINKLLSYISRNPRFLLVITAFVVVFLFSLHIYESSKLPWLSFWMFITLGMYGESLCLIRQYIAVVLILISYDSIKNNKLVPFIVIVLLATSIHTSALIVLPMFWISKIHWNKIHFFLILGFSAVLWNIVTKPLFVDKIIIFFKQYTTYARYLSELNYGRSGGAVGLALIYFSFLFLLILKLYNSNIDSRNMYIAFALASFVVALFSFIVNIGERILPFFSAMFLFSVPEAIINEPKHKVRIQYIFVICVVLTIYYIGIVCRANSFQLIPYQLWDDTIKWF